MNGIFETVVEFRALITVVIVAIGYVLLDYRNKKVALKEYILSAMLRAEKWANKQVHVHGEEIMNKVVDIVYHEYVVKLPPWVKQFLTEEKVREIAQFLYDKAKEKIYIE